MVAPAPTRTPCITQALLPTVTPASMWLWLAMLAPGMTVTASSSRASWPMVAL